MCIPIPRRIKHIPLSLLDDGEEVRADTVGINSSAQREAFHKPPPSVAYLKEDLPQTVTKTPD